MLFDPTLCLFLSSTFSFFASSFTLLLLFPLTTALSDFHTSVSHTHQAQRKADSLHQSLSAIGDKVKQQTAPNKDIQKEIADMTEVSGIFVLQMVSQQNTSVSFWYQHVHRLCSR